jgi:Haem-NO-binding
MKGVVFKLLEESVRQEYGEDAWDDLLDAAGLEGTYTSLGSYPDADLMKLVSAASSSLNLPPEAVVRWFGRQALPLMAESYPHFFQPHTSTRAFVLTLNDIIHPEVRKIYPGADVPEFDFDASSEEVLVMGYRSPRKLCSLAQGLIEGAAAHYGEAVMFEQLQCMHRGDDKCVFRLTFRKLETGANG